MSEKVSDVQIRSGWFRASSRLQPGFLGGSDCWTHPKVIPNVRPATLDTPSPRSLTGLLIRSMLVPGWSFNGWTQSWGNLRRRSVGSVFYPDKSRNNFDDKLLLTNAFTSLTIKEPSVNQSGAGGGNFCSLAPPCTREEWHHVHVWVFSTLEWLRACGRSEHPSSIRGLHQPSVGLTGSETTFISPPSNKYWDAHKRGKLIGPS